MSEKGPELSAIIREALKSSLGGLPVADEHWIAAIAASMAREIIAAARSGPEGQTYAPDQYTLLLHPSLEEERRAWTERLQKRFSVRLYRELLASGYQMAGEPHITLATDPTLGVDEARIICWHSSNPLALADGIEAEEEADTQRPPEGAFLVVEGKRHFRLRKTFIRIGRRLDNDLVLNDPRVSRHHLQLVARHGRYIARDAGSTAGTYVNGRKIEERVLKPGDVIQVAAIELIYGEDKGGPPDRTLPYEPGEGTEAQDEQITPLNLKNLPEAKTAKLG